MGKGALTCLCALLLIACASVPPLTPQGSFVEVESIEAEGLPNQRLSVWLPPGYAESERRYPVLYMQDGHNLFDVANSNFQKIWAADKAMLQLIEKGSVEPHIIVGIWAPGEDRYRQYLPQFVGEKANGALARDIDRNALGRPIVSARYLDWIVRELKPQIDGQYRTKTGAMDTAIVGSSMGGLMSCYAIVERPDVFGRAGCVSSHWPIALPREAERDQAKAIWRGWFSAKLGDPNGRKIWMDHGTATLDQYYAPYQRAVNGGFVEAGWREGTDFRSEVYEGAEHDEIAWAKRLPEILEWLLSEP